MSDAQVYGLIGALGAALIAAAGAVWLQRGTRRDGAATRRRAEAERALEAAAKARTTAKTWNRAIGRVLDDVEAGRPVDVSAFDEQLAELESALADALHKLSATGVELAAPAAPVPQTR